MEQGSHSNTLSVILPALIFGGNNFYNSPCYENWGQTGVFPAQVQCFTKGKLNRCHTFPNTSIT